MVNRQMGQNSNDNSKSLLSPALLRNTADGAIRSRLASNVGGTGDAASSQVTETLTQLNQQLLQLQIAGQAQTQATTDNTDQAVIAEHDARLARRGVRLSAQ